MESVSGVVEQVRASAALVAKESRHVVIVDEKIDEFVDGLDWNKFQDLSSPSDFPLQFTLRSRVNFDAVNSLLEIGSGFRLALKNSPSQRGAHETIVSGLFAMFITHGDITAQHMTSLSLADVTEMFQLPVAVEKPVSSVGGGTLMTQYVDSPLKPLVVFIHRVLQDTGRVLQQRKCADFFDLFCKELIPTKENPLCALKMTDMLCSLFPAFADSALYGPQKKKVWMAKKAQLCAATLQRSVGRQHEEWNVRNTDKLTVFTDNVLPCVLRYLGVMKIVNEELVTTIDAGKVLATGDEEIELRLLAVEACERIVKKWNEKKGTTQPMTAALLDMYLWRLGKEPGFRDKNRHYTQNTVFY